MTYETFKLYPMSYSKLSKFETCEYQWKNQYIDKNIQFVDSPATVWGSDVHDAFDVRFKTGEPLVGRFESYEKFAKSIEKAANGATIASEYELVVDADDNRVGWDDLSAFMRGRIDVAVFYPDGRMLIYDHKTGNRRVNDELRFFAMMSFILHPEVHTIKNVFAWYKLDGCPLDSEIIKREELPMLRKKFADKIALIENALEFDRFRKKKSGLCAKFCGSPVCEHSGQFKGFEK